MVCVGLISCQDVVDVDVPNDSPRLIVDALIRLEENHTNVVIRIKTRLSSSFFDNVVPTSVDQMTLTNEQSGNSFTLIENGSGSGIYETSVSSLFLTEGSLLLSISHDGQDYAARTSYVPSVPIEKLEQGDATLFEGTETEIVVAFTDAPDRTDFYLFDFDFGEYLVTEDTFYPGQTFQFSYFYDEDLQASRKVDISLLGVDKSFFNYMNQIIAQSSGGDQGPFQTPAATVRGNIVNVTDLGGESQEDNFALGYFAVCQSFSDSIVIE